MPLPAPHRSAPNPASARTCGTCTLCCRLPDIDALSKPANAWCRHCTPGAGCAIYAERPQLCRDFLCRYMTQADMAEHWHPLEAGMMVYAQGVQLTVLVDPALPERWREEPYAADLARWAGEAEASGGYLVVFVGDAVFKVEPHHRPAAVKL